VQTTPPPPAAAAAAAPPAPSSPSTLMGLPMLGAAADKLRAFVHRCQSANDLESLKAFMLQQPPEPSNACFEPGGRFYSGSAAANPGSSQQAAGSSAAAAAAAKHGMSGHDSAASLGVHGGSSSSSSSSSRPAELPRGPSSGLPVSPSTVSPFPPPKPLQLVPLPVSLRDVPRSDSCRSLQGISEGKAEGKDSSMGGDNQQQQQRLHGSLQGVASSSPMAVSPAAPGGSLQQQQQQQQQLGSKGVTRSLFDSPKSAGRSPREQHSPTRSATDAAASPSTSSCSCSCSSSCESGMVGSARGSVSSSHSWGYTQQQQQQQPSPHQPPQPPSPPCHHASKACAVHSPFGSCHDSVTPGYATASAPGKSAAGPIAEGAIAVEAAGRNGSCQELEQLMGICRPGHAMAMGGAAAAAAKRTVLTISADCRTISEAEQQQQQQQLAGLSGQNNGCFGFLKSPRR
jgi:hypothetical protein